MIIMRLALLDADRAAPWQGARIARASSASGGPAMEVGT